MALEDQKMRDRINCLIDSAADQPYALEIRYHRKCWLKKFQKMSEDDKLPQMQNITYREVQTMFFDHTQKVIFEEGHCRASSEITARSFLLLGFQHLVSGHHSSKRFFIESLRGE